LTDFDKLLLGSEEPFATGASRYSDAHPDLAEPYPRIYVRFRPQGADISLSLLALLDTGAHFCILNQEVADFARHQLTETIGQARLGTAYGVLSGELYRLGIELVAQIGDDLDIETVALITPDWHGPSFIGYCGALERLRFAVDPTVNRFYFGRLS